MGKYREKRGKRNWEEGEKLYVEEVGKNYWEEEVGKETGKKKWG